MSSEITFIIENLPEEGLNIEIDEDLYEYSREAYEYLRGVEEAFVIPQDYLESSNITSNMRMILVDWLSLST